MRVLLNISVALLTLVLLIAPANAAEVAAHFNGGGSNTAPITDEVDAYFGMGGSGWTAGWSENSSLNCNAITDNTNPLGVDTGNYLDITAVATSASTGFGTARSYSAGIDVSQSHTIEFKYRINEDLSDLVLGNFNNSNDRYQLFDVAYDRKTASGDCSWIIGCYGGDSTWLNPADIGYWVVYDGDNDRGGFLADHQVNSGILVQTGVTYDFRIDVNAVSKTWDVTIGTGGTTLYDSTALHPEGLGWRTNAATVAGRPGFGCYANSEGDTRAYSLDSFKITGTPFGPYGGMTSVAAHFSGGNSETVVDAYVGMAGDGWKSPWAQEVSRMDVAATVISPGEGGFVEVKSGTGAYLSVTTTQNTDNALGLAAVTRDYRTTTAPGIDWSDLHTIKFTVRIDEDITNFTDFDDRYLFHDSSESRSGPNSMSTWMIVAYGGEGEYAGAEVVGQWSFCDGDGLGGELVASMNVDTNIDLVSGGVYDFTIVVDPTTQTYDATVSDGTNSFTANDLGWRTSAHEVGGYLSFCTRSAELGETRAFSLDALVISEGGAVPTIPGDTDGNNIVNEIDAAVLAQNWGANVGASGFAMGDFNGDELVNAADAAILAANWGDHNPPESAAVPEPSTVALLMAGLALMGIRRRR
ncbi:MAG: PEP-CTERM sorting domain-containing protein [Pirellulales bacterium]|nr:PEP-CTERM sorting domain-containing protein [Pirellulales bacterium]